MDANAIEIAGHWAGDPLGKSFLKVRKEGRRLVDVAHENAMTIREESWLVYRNGKTLLFIPDPGWQQKLGYSVKGGVHIVRLGK